MQLPSTPRRLAAVFLILLFVFIASPASAATPQPGESAEQDVSGADINATIAGLSDEQVRSLLIKELQQEKDTAPKKQGAQGPGSLFDRMLSSLAGVSSDSGSQARLLFDKLPAVPGDLYQILVSISADNTLQGALVNSGWVIFIILAGLAVERGMKRLILPRLFRPEVASAHISSGQNIEKLTAALVLELPALLGLFFFFGSSYLLYLWLMPLDQSALSLVFMALLLSVTLIRGIWLIARIIFSPTSPSLRILPLECTMAATIYQLTSWAFSYAVVTMMFIVVTKKLGAQHATTILLQLVFASLLVVVTAALVFLYRARVKEQILSSTAIYGEEPSWGRQQFAAIWHIPALVYLFCIWMLLFMSLLNPDEHRRGAFLFSFFILPIWIVADILVQWIVRHAMETLKIYSEQSVAKNEASEEELAQRQRGRITSQRLMLTCRSGLVLGMLVWVASLWNITVPFLSRISSVMFDAIVILTLAMLFWKLVSGWIERKIAESLPSEDETAKEEDDEWGSTAARGRSYTLLPMIRRFIGTVLVTMVTLTLLSALGVDIGPLLAGAGVVGLAVGFGAQKLVADMLSGFFYLLDDAFRVGEYIEAGGIAGTVENISLRNVMLRHHRGMLQIVPHSELGSITNYMRGGIIVKFNLDFPYDADIDKIRKIIKKVGIAMMEDEELGPDFLKPVKSQGVREITNSVMTIRVKFTAKPGTHFVIRREAYRRITEALREKGIEYAHRKVIVDIPQSPNGAPPSQEQIRQAAAAAAQRQIEDEQRAAAEAAAKTSEA